MNMGNQMLNGLTDAIATAAPSLDRAQSETAALAVVRALRNPTQDVLEAAFPGLPFTGYVRDDWQSIVDAILAPATFQPTPCAR